ncbi:MAG TPA: hypothetical protein VLC71_11280 [Thermomonas sp.]|nr:hypothetical protein [Thermomonas sp.]
MPGAPASPFSLRFEVSGRALEATVGGRVDGTSDAIALFLALAGEVRRVAASRLLVIDHSEGVVPAEDGLRQLMAAMGGQGLQEIRIAYVDARGTAVGRMELAEIVGREHGYDCRVFGEESRARLWLEYGER